MFAYCGNNPIMFSDPSGYMHNTIFPIDITGIGGTMKEPTPPDNIYTKTSGFVNGQEVCPYSETRMGLGTYGKNGCGIIAVYNAMQLLGYHESLATIDTLLYVNGGYCMGGLLGIVPWAIEDCFAGYGISCSGYSSFAQLSQAVQEGSVIVFLVINDVNSVFRGAHYMAAQYTNGTYVVYNMYKTYTKPVTANSLKSPYGNSAFVYGFIVGGKMKKISLYLLSILIAIALSGCILVDQADQMYPWSYANDWYCEEIDMSIRFHVGSSGMVSEATNSQLTVAGKTYQVGIGLNQNAIGFLSDLDGDGISERVLDGTWFYRGENMVISIHEDTILGGRFSELVFVPDTTPESTGSFLENN